MRLHRLLLRLYPRSFRNEYGEEMRRVFARRRRDAGGFGGVVSLWASEIADTVLNAARVHTDILRQDLRHSFRSIRRAPGFFLAASVVTALGIAATTATFTVTDHVLLRPLPYPDSDRLVKIWEGPAVRPPGMHGMQGTNDVSAANYRDWKQMSSSFEVMGIYGSAAANLVGSGLPERLSGATMSTDAMRVIGIAPAIGRAFDDRDDQPGAACVILISHGFWSQKYLADRTVIGQRVQIDDESCEIAGVMPRGFDFPSRDTTFWRPIRLRPENFEDRTDTFLRVIARMKPGVQKEQAIADMDRVSAQLARLYPVDNKDLGAVVIGLREEVADQSRILIYAMAGASACLLLIACTNLTSLFLARATSRAPELAVRSALGAGSERLVRQLVTDALLIGTVGGAVGVGLAVAAIPLLSRLAPSGLPIAELPGVDARMLMIALAGVLITVVVAGVLPALRASRQATAGALRDGARTGASRHTERLRSGLVLAQVAASVALLVCAGLLLRALWRVQAIDPGFKSEDVLTMRVNLPVSDYHNNAPRVQFHQRVIDDVSKLPGVAGAAFASYLPLTMRGGLWPMFLPGRVVQTGNETQNALSRFVTPDYFAVMGIPIKQGRSFDARDGIRGEPTAIVSETFGRAMWPGESMLGKQFVVMQALRTIVGVVGEVKLRGLERRSEPQLYMPAAQQDDDANIGFIPRDLAVRTSRPLNGAETGSLSAAIRAIVAKADPKLPISNVQPLTEIVLSDTATRAVQANVLRAFAVVACVLAAVGLHGLLSFMVTARTREIGVRLALGARRGQILAMVMRRGLVLAVVGAVIGLGVGFLAGRSFSAILAGVSPADALTYSIAFTLAIVITLAGSLWPALRAAGTDPMIATRTD